MAVILSVTLLVCGAFYTASEERLSYAQLPDEPAAHSSFPQLAGMATPGPYLSNFDELLRYAQANIPVADGIVLLPGEDPFYFVTGRTPQFPVLLFDPATDPYSPAQLAGGSSNASNSLADCETGTRDQRRSNSAARSHTERRCSQPSPRSLISAPTTSTGADKRSPATNLRLALCLPRPLQIFPILFRLVGVGRAELRQRLGKSCRPYPGSPRSPPDRPERPCPRASNSPQTSA